MQNTVQLEQFLASGGIKREMTLDQRLKVLEIFRSERGAGAIPTVRDANRHYVALRQWINRMRRAMQSGNLPGEVVARLQLAGIPLKQSEHKRAQAAAYIEASFRANLAALSSWLDAREKASGTRNLAYRDIAKDKVAKKAYHFIEHLVLKARQGTLAGRHREALCRLGFTVNGVRIVERIVAGHSIREQNVLGETGGRLDSEACAAHEIITQFEAVARRSGGSMYLYQPGTPLMRITSYRENHAYVLLAYSMEGEDFMMKVKKEARRLGPALAALQTTWFEWAFLLPTADPDAQEEARRHHIARAPDKRRYDKRLPPGTRHGALVILGRTARPDDDRHSGHFCRCRCDCGNETVRRRDEIVARSFPTCGCRIQHDLSGQTFGRLVTLPHRRQTGPGGRCTEWRVRCACGNEKWVRASSLKAGKTRSCGCLRPPAVHAGQPAAIERVAA